MSRFVGRVSRVSEFVPDDLPARPVMFPEGPWNELLDGVVDEAATGALGSMPGNQAVRTTHGLKGQGGVPWQYATKTGTAVFTDVKVHGIRRVKVPLANETRRTGDPNGLNQDRQAFLFDGREYVELSSLNPTVWGRAFAASVQIGSMSRWDMNQRWDSQGVKGTAAIKAPVVPHVATPDEFARGFIGHAQMLAVTYYQPLKVTGYARGTDGGTKPEHLANDLVSPLVAGMRMRITAERHRRLVELFAECPHVVTLLTALRDYGVVVADRTDPDQGHLLRLPQTGQIDLRGLALKITDFEIVQPT